VPYTRAGFNFGAVSIANMEFENVTSDVTNVFGASSPEAAEAKSNPHPGERQPRVPRLHVHYDEAWGKFFARLEKDGITKENTLFLVTADEGDHFAGGAPSPASCDGTHVPCTYAKLGEIDANLTSLLNKQDPSLAATRFDAHFDMAPTLYVQGNPAPGSPNARAYERATAQLTTTSVITGKQDQPKTPWTNFFEPPITKAPRAPDDDVLRYVRQSNDLAADRTLLLPKSLSPLPHDWDIDGNQAWDGYAPDVWFRFDDHGFDLRPDGTRSGWRAFAHYPFPGTFFPANGSAADVLVRLPAPFQNDVQGRRDGRIYEINLAIVEALATRSDVANEPVDEADLAPWRRRDHGIADEGGAVREESGLPRLRGAARPGGARRAQARALPGREPPRELARRARHRQWPGVGLPGLHRSQGRHAPPAVTRGDRLLRRLPRRPRRNHGFHLLLPAEALRRGVLARLVPLVAARPRGRPRTEAGAYEYTKYLEEAGAGDELRENAEVIRRFFDERGDLRPDAIRTLHHDVASLLLPSPARALDLDRAYHAVVEAQTFARARDAVLAVSQNVHATVPIGEATGVLTPVRMAGLPREDRRTTAARARPTPNPSRSH
jgi:hypothetical protein